MILITGASSGLGKTIFESFLEKGIPVQGTYHASKPDNTEYYKQVDVSDYQQVQQWIASCPLDENMVLINAAGITINEMFHKSEPQNWNQVLSVNLDGIYNTCRAILPHMRKNNYGRIINISSVVAQKGTPGTASYSASKAALSGLVKTLAVENAKHNITVNNLMLGYFNTGMINNIPAEMLEKIKSEIPAGRFGEPNELFRAIEFLIDSPYVNGTDLNMNGAYF
jgi:NAD(P)-dependent dehydrogenase (short-subunit alcohol dehydrogenase family)